MASTIGNGAVATTDGNTDYSVNSRTFIRCTVNNDATNGKNGGALNLGKTTTTTESMENCFFFNNNAKAGKDLYFASAPTAAIFSNCYTTLALTDSIGYGGSGGNVPEFKDLTEEGALSVKDTTLTIEGCSFESIAMGAASLLAFDATVASKTTIELGDGTTFDSCRSGGVGRAYGDPAHPGPAQGRRHAPLLRGHTAEGGAHLPRSRLPAP